MLLVKPQFEVGKGNLGKNGIVESETLREQALKTVVACAKANGLDARATAVSPIEGTHGNIESGMKLTYSAVERFSIPSPIRMKTLLRGGDSIKAESYLRHL